MKPMETETMNKAEELNPPPTQQVPHERVVMHPPEVVAVLSRLKGRPGYGATLMQPEHWTIKYAEEKGLVKTGPEYCGPLKTPTGETHCRLTEEGRAIVGA